LPALGSKMENLGFFYFTKTPEGRVQSFYIQTKQKDGTKSNGMAAFVDFDNQTYTVATYENNKPVALYGMRNATSLFHDAFSGTDKQLTPRVNGGCAEATSIVKTENGNDSIIVNTIKAHGGIECPGNKTFWQQLGDFFSGIWGGITDAFDWLFGWAGGGIGGSAAGAYTGGGAFSGGGYSGWDFSSFIGSGVSGSGVSGSGGWGSYHDPNASSDPPPPFIWIFSGDDGTTMSDPNPSIEPDLQFDPADNIETKYPNLTNLVKNLKSFVKNTPEVMSALQNYSGMSKQKILEILTYGKGLTVKVDDIDMEGKYANYNRVKYGVNILRIRGSYVRGLEIAVLPSTKRATAFLLAASMLHELVHYGTGQNKINEGVYDFGYGFERDAFTMIVEDDNAGNLVVLFKKF